MRAKHINQIQSGPATLGELIVQSKESQFTYKLAAIGTVGNRDGVIAILSTVASQTAIKALHACVSKAVKTEFHADCDGRSPFWNPKPCELGYRFYTAKLGLGAWQSLAIARLPGLIAKLTDSSLWTELSRDAITTPLLQSWIPWLRAELIREEHLTPLESFQCDGAVLNLTTESLDKIVSKGLKRRRLTI